MDINIRSNKKSYIFRPDKGYLDTLTSLLSFFKENNIVFQIGDKTLDTLILDCNTHYKKKMNAVELKAKLDMILQDVIIGDRVQYGVLKTAKAFVLALMDEDPKLKLAIKGILTRKPRKKKSNPTDVNPEA